MPEAPDDSPQVPSDDETQLMTPPTSGGSILPTGAAPVREVIGDFEVLEKLGAGGMGAVYRARQVSLGRIVALKILPAHMVEDAESVSRFQREARVAAGLTHANLVRVYAAGQADGCHYIAMELIEGEDLGRRIKRDGKLPAPEALRICAEVARGLQYGWERAQLIHRDIKPANIFLTADGAVKLGDLGLAKSLDAHTTGLTQTGTMMGTPHYISPEQARADRAIDFRADVYSLGCTLYHMLTGQVPYGGTDAITVIRQHLDAPLPAILKAWPQCPVPLARLVGKMLKKSRHERQANYGELIGQIESVWAQIDPLSFDPEGFAPPSAPNSEVTLFDSPLTPPRASAAVAPRKSKVPLYGGIVAGLVVLGLGVFLALPKPEKLTQAQIAMAQRAAEEKAAATHRAEEERAPASEVTARKDKPLVNSLGMKFVPIPGTAILLCIHQTRKVDYAVYAAEYPDPWIAWKNPISDGVPITPGDDYPVTQVSWDDAKAFCAWLGKKEGRTYRLPTDREWSVAVGLGDLEDKTATPESLSSKFSEEYPWGSQWPPPKGAGNFADAAHQEKWPNNEVIEGYADGYPTTAPVMSFSPNKLGLYDLGGNLADWCEDWSNAEQKERVTRGSNWRTGLRTQMRSSNRGKNFQSNRGQQSYGFRCAIVLSPGPAVARDATTTLPPHAPKALPPVTPSAAPTDESWVDALAEWWAKPAEPNNLLAKEGSGVRVLNREGIYLAQRAVMGDVAVRATVRGITDKCVIHIRDELSPGGEPHNYSGVLFRNGLTRIFLNSKGSGSFGASPPPAGFDRASSHTLEFYAQGNQLSLKLDGEETTSIKNGTIRTGLFYLMCDPDTVIEKLEYRRLPAGAALP